MIAFVPWTSRRGARTAHDDAALAAGVAARDSVTIEALYRRDAAAVYRYALALGGNAGWAADATQEAFVALVERRARFDPARGDSLAAFLGGIARHHLLKVWRERPLAELDEDDGDAAAEAVEASPESRLVQRQDHEALWAALRALPWPQREALVLVDLQQRPYAEAAAIAGIEPNTLRTRLHRGRDRLARLLGARS